VRKALGDFYRKAGERWWRRQQGSDLGEKMAAPFDWFAGGDALDYSVVKQTTNTFDVNVRDAAMPSSSTRSATPNSAFSWYAMPTFP
jgi:hypothetical protein